MAWKRHKRPNHAINGVLKPLTATKRQQWYVSAINGTQKPEMAPERHETALSLGHPNISASCDTWHKAP